MNVQVCECVFAKFESKLTAESLLRLGAVQTCCISGLLEWHKESIKAMLCITYVHAYISLYKCVYVCVISQASLTHAHGFYYILYIVRKFSLSLIG